MFYTIKVIFLILLLIAALFILYRLRRANLAKRSLLYNASAQHLYNVNKKKNQKEKINLTLHEKIELSWQFLVNIAEQVSERFSTPDKKSLEIAGEKLNNHGMKYLHNVDQETSVTFNVIEKRVAEMNKDKEKSR